MVEEWDAEVMSERKKKCRLKGKIEADNSCGGTRWAQGRRRTVNVKVEIEFLLHFGWKANKKMKRWLLPDWQLNSSSSSWWRRAPPTTTTPPPPLPLPTPTPPLPLPTPPGVEYHLRRLQECLKERREPCAESAHRCKRCTLMTKKRRKCRKEEDGKRGGEQKKKNQIV